MGSKNKKIEDILEREKKNKEITNILKGKKNVNVENLLEKDKKKEKKNL